MSLILGRFRSLGAAQYAVRSFSAMPALHTPLSSAAEEHADAQPSVKNITTLPNGLRVASIEAHGNCSSIGVFVEAGSRLEDSMSNGATHMLQHLAFAGTQQRTGFRLLRQAERMGGTFQATPQHELMVFSGDTVRPQAMELLDILAECTSQPAFTPWSLKEAAAAAARDSKEMASNPPAHVAELMHTAGFGGVGLGRPLYTRKSNYDALTPETLGAFWSSSLSLDRMCVAAINVNHAELESAASAALGHLPSAASVPKQPARYVGGDFRSESDQGSTVVGLAFEGASWSSKNLIAVSLLHSLMGGGSSFSAGGPGKGMMSRLYSNVLNRYHEVQSANVFNTFYSDSGIFGVYGETDGPLAGMLVDVLANELSGMAKAIQPEELQRAKNQLKGSILGNLEHRHVQVDDIGRQVLATGTHLSATDACKQIDAITAEELLSVARSMLKSPLTFVAHGDLTSIPRYEEVAKRFQ